MTSPPDWALSVPSSPSVHTAPGSSTGTGVVPPNQLALMCQALLGGSPFAAGTMDLGSDDPSTIGSLTSGGQFIADSLCELGTGSPSLGTTPQSLLDGAEETSDTLLGNPFLSGVVDLGAPASNLGLSGFNGGMSFLGSLFALIAPCGCGGGFDPDTATPDSLLDSAEEVSTAFNANPFATGLLNLGQQGGGSGNLALDGLLGAQRYDGMLLNNFSYLSILAHDRVPDTTQSILVDFTQSSSVSAGDGWSHDAAEGHTSAGSAKVVADGLADNELVSSEMWVTPGQKIEVSAWVKWTGISYTGTDPIALGVTYYARNPSTGVMDEIGWEDVDSFNTPDAASSNASENDFIELSNTSFEIPALVGSSAPEQVRLRFKIRGTMSAGTVWWDDAKLANRSSIVNSITNPLYGFDFDSVFNWNIADSLNALLQQNNSVISSQAQINALWTAITGSGGGGEQATTDEFERSAGTLGSDWDENYSSGNGDWAIDGHAVYWQDVYPNGNRDSVCLWTGSPSGSSTDYQTVSLILGSAPGSSGFDFGYNSLIGRADTNAAPGAGNYIYFKITGTGAWELGKVISGAATVMDSGTTAVPGAGTVISLICGDKDSTTPRHYTVKISNATLTSGDFGDTTSNYGASYRNWGFGGGTDNPLYYGWTESWYAPGRINAWSARDT